jgi:hypothetical protein
MTLLNKLEDSKEGLMGITEDGERVHLGAPMAAYNHIYNYGLTSRRNVLRAFVSGLDKYTKRVRRKKYQDLEKNLRESEEYCYIQPDEDGLDFSHMCARDDQTLSFACSYLVFGTEKEKVFRSQGQE